MNRSEAINELAEALAKAQEQMRAVGKDNTATINSTKGSYKYEYADLAAMLSMLRKPLTDNGLALMQAPAMGKGCVSVETVLSHTSGQWVSATIDLPIGEQADVKAIGSAITYGRRYGLSLVGAVSGDEDDDSAQADDKPQQQERKPQPARQQAQQPAPAARPQQPTQQATPAHERIFTRFAEIAGGDQAPADEIQLRKAKTALGILSKDQNTRHTVTGFLCGTDDPTKWTAGQAAALVRWINPSKLTGPEGEVWAPSAQAVDETRIIVEHVVRTLEAQQAAQAA